MGDVRNKRERIATLLATIRDASTELARLLSTQERTPRVRVIEAPAEATDLDAAFAEQVLNQHGHSVRRKR